MWTLQSSTSGGCQRSFLFWISVFFVSLGSITIFSTSSLQAQGSPLTVQPSTGNVGIGTTSPNTKLWVEGSNSGGYVSTFYNSFNGSGGKAVRIVNRENSANGAILSLESGDILTADKLVTVLGNGNVGIGTTSPQGLLDIRGNGTTVNPHIWLQDTNGGNIWRLGPGAVGASKFAIYDETAAAARFTVGSTGNVGIGTTSPPTGGGPALAFSQGTNPTGIGVNTAGILAKDLAGTATMHAFDEAGNVTLLSPHPADFLNSLPLSAGRFPGHTTLRTSTWVSGSR